LKVRPASPHDAKSIAALLGELGYPADAGQVGARMKRLDTSGGDAAHDALFVATDDGSNAPIGVLALHRFAGIHDDADVALIMALVISERARGRGVGRKLVDAASETAFRWGCRKLMVTTHVRRADAHAFYERIGFDLTGRRYVKTL
jgi:GNAT superfamily N-acetyltransferase